MRVTAWFESLVVHTAVENPRMIESWITNALLLALAFLLYSILEKLSRILHALRDR